MSSEVASTRWGHSMDLLALTTFDHLVELYRISYKAQRVFQSEESGPITSMAFSPDGTLPPTKRTSSPTAWKTAPSAWSALKMASRCWWLRAVTALWKACPS